jgi:DNA-binding XRE family transcriptional regulator
MGISSTIIIDKPVPDVASTIIVETMTPAQSRAARALLEISQTILARKAGLGLSTIVDFEKERRLVSDDAKIAIAAAFESEGIIFIEENGGGEGVRLRKPRRLRK